jgi:hypothetical protein
MYKVNGLLRKNLLPPDNNQQHCGHQDLKVCSTWYEYGIFFSVVKTSAAFVDNTVTEENHEKP